MISAYRNITLTDAKDIVRGVSASSSSPIYLYASDEYPELALLGKEISFTNLKKKPILYAQASARINPLLALSHMLYIPSSSSSSSSCPGGVWIPRIKC